MLPIWGEEKSQLVHWSVYDVPQEKKIDEERKLSKVAFDILEDQSKFLQKTKQDFLARLQYLKLQQEQDLIVDWWQWGSHR